MNNKFMSQETLKLEIPSEYRNKRLEFSDSFVDYNGARIYYKDIIGLSYSSVRRSVNFVPTNQTYNIVILDDNKKININFNSSFLLIGNKKKGDLFSTIIYVVERVIKPYLLINLLEQLEKNEKIEIGSLTLTKDGLSRRTFFRRKLKLLPWEEYAGSQASQGYIQILGEIPEKGNRKYQFDSISLDAINAVALPELAEYLKARGKNIKIKKEKEPSFNLFCANCGNKVRRTANFCNQCGEKLKK